MGKKAFQVKFDKNTLKNVGKNALGLGAGAALAGGAPLTALGMGALGGLFKKGDSPGPKLSQGAFDISQQAKQYEDLLAKQREQNLAASQELTTQLQQQARGEGPLAGAQLRAAQNRNLAQTLSAAQTAGASPLAARQMLQTRAQQSRDLAELGQQERLQAQQALAQQIAQQSGMSRADITTGFGIAKAPQELMADYEKARFAADVARRNAVQQQQSGILGGLLSAGSSIGAAAMMSDEDQKEPSTEDKTAKKKQDFKELLASMTPTKDAGEGIANAGKAIAAVMSARQNSKTASTVSPAILQSGSANVPRISSNIMSDKTQKKFPTANKEVNEMMDKLEPKKYQYKDTSLPGTAEGTRYGIMAQDLEKSTLGKTLVKQTENGKMIDTVQGFGAVLAAQAELNRRLKKIEKKGK